MLHLDDDSFLHLSKRMLESKHDVRVVRETVRKRYPDLPFMLFTGKGSEEVAGETISAGVTDYIRKGPDTERFTVLATRIANAVERYRARKQAAASTRRLRRIHERIDDGWEFTYVSRQGAELLGTTLWDAFPGAVGSRFEAKYRQALEPQETVTFEEYYEPLETWFEVRAFLSDSGLSIYFRDVTERKERELRREAVFENTHQFTGLAEPDGTLIEANETALAFVGADRGAVVGEPLWEPPWFQASDETIAIAHRSVEAARSGELYREESRTEGAGGETVVIDYSVRPVRDGTGEIALLVPGGRDITERKERERRLEMKNDQLEEFGPRRLPRPEEPADDRERERRAGPRDRRRDASGGRRGRAGPHGGDGGRPAHARQAGVRRRGARAGPAGVAGSDRRDRHRHRRRHRLPGGRGRRGRRETVPLAVHHPLSNATEHGGDVAVEVGLEGDTLYVADDRVGVPESDR